jgi:predicted ATPase/DNA-binding SARP family transcriptional activator/uncharacterized protein HemY
MSHLSIRLLGPPLVERDGVPIEVDTRKAIALLAYLAVTGQPQRRSSLAAFFWPDSDSTRALTALRRTLTALGQAIGKEWLDADRATIGLNEPGPADTLTVDSRAFRRLLQQCAQSAGHDCADCLEPLAEGVALHRGEFLEGFTLTDSPAFDEWQFFQAEGFRQELAGALRLLLRCQRAEHHYESAIESARRWLALDPLHEPAHQQLMELYALAGQRSAALRQYQECERVLQEELGVEPQPETRELYRQILSDKLAPRPESQTTAAVTPAVSHLPTQPTTFIGRQEELGRIRALLANPACRLLTLVGPGGIGKSRLAVQAAFENQGAFAHGAHFVPLSAVRSADFLVPAIADGLNFSFYSQEEPYVQLINYLRGKEMLLVLDNFEHLLDAATLLSDFLNRAPGMKVVATSQERLNLQEEWLLELYGLGCPESSSSLEEMSQCSAVQLFLDRAGRVRPGFAPTDDELGAVAHICRLVGGMPLGIELASAWARVLSAAEIAQQIQTSLDFLETSLRNVPERHRSMRAIFERTWQYLSPQEKSVFRRLSIFNGSFSATAAATIAGASLPLLMALADKSLLRRTHNGRYQLPELLSQYAKEKLQESAEEQQQTRQNFVTFYERFLAEREPFLHSQHEKEALTAIAQEIENVRQAWHWLVATAAWPQAGRALESLFIFYEVCSRFQEGEEMVGSAVAALPAVTATSLGPDGEIVRGRLLTRQAALRLRLSRYEEARPLLEEALALAERQQQAAEAALARSYLGLIADHTGQYDSARQWLLASLEEYRAIGDQWGIANALNVLGNLYQGRGQYAEARPVYQESLALRRQMGDRRSEALSLHNLGNLAYLLGEYDEAVGLFSASIAIKDELADRRGIAYSLINLGYIAYLRHQYEEAQSHLQESLAIVAEIGDRRGTAYALTNLGNVAYDQGDYGEAKVRYQESLRIFGEINDRVGVAFSLEDLGNTEQALGNPAAASEQYRQALRTALDVKAMPVALGVLLGMARVLQGEGKAAEALELVFYVLQHEAAARSTRDQAEQLRQEVAAGLTPEQIAVAQEHAQTITFE